MDGDGKRSAHDLDFHAWADERATPLRAGRLSGIDVMLPWSCPCRFEQAVDEASWPDPA